MCHEMASPSRSGSVARMIASARFALEMSSRTTPSLARSAQRIAKSSSGTTEPLFSTRSRTWPYDATTVYPGPKYVCTFVAFAGDSTMTSFPTDEGADDEAARAAAGREENGTGKEAAVEEEEDARESRPADANRPSGSHARAAADENPARVSGGAPRSAGVEARGTRMRARAPRANAPRANAIAREGPAARPRSSLPGVMRDESETPGASATRIKRRRSEARRERRATPPRTRRRGLRLEGSAVASDGARGGESGALGFSSRKRGAESFYSGERDLL